MKNGFRQCMAWLHTWAGVSLGWLLFAVFLTGSIAYFRQEVTVWMQPELHVDASDGQAAEVALAKLAEVAPGAESWTVSLPSERADTVGIGWRMPGAPRGRRGGESATLNPQTGDVLEGRETAGGNFLYRFHFELYALPRDVARWIVGIATLAMFVAIISGVITHKKIFKDFFTFRPGKGQRSWLDFHNVTAVLALPFHLMITYSGLMLFMTTLMPYALENGGRRGPPPQRAEAQVERPAADIAPTPLVPITGLMAQAEEIWGMGVGRISVDKPASTAPTIEFAPMHNTRLIAHSGSGSNGVERLRFNGATGELLKSDDGGVARLSAVRAVNNALGSLHRGRFADTGMRWLFFLSGIAGTIMVGTGLLLWVAKRGVKHAKDGVYPLGFRLVERLNVGTVAGLPVAVAGYFWANRLLPADLAGRADWEIRTFFIVWAVALLHPYLRPVAKAWREQLILAGVLLTGLPVLNAITTSSHLGWSLPRGHWIVAGVDLMALLIGIGFFYAVHILRRRENKARGATPSRDKRAAAPGMVEKAA